MCQALFNNSWQSIDELKSVPMATTGAKVVGGLHRTRPNCSGRPRSNSQAVHLRRLTDTDGIGANGCWSMDHNVVACHRFQIEGSLLVGRRPLAELGRLDRVFHRKFAFLYQLLCFGHVGLCPFHPYRSLLPSFDLHLPFPFGIFTGGGIDVASCR